MPETEQSSREPQLLTLADVAKYLKIAERTAYQWVKDGRLPGFKLGNAWRFDRADIEAWVQKHKNEGLSRNS
jgi:excisionase family DNA binding protein